MTNCTTEEGNDESKDAPGQQTLHAPFWWERPDFHYRKDADAVFFGQACLEEILIDAGHLPMFVYRPARFAEKAVFLRSVLPGATILYAVKANRHPAILAQALQFVDGIDVCSPNEVRLALASGFTEQQISYTGTSLSDTDIDFLAEHPTIHINADSLSLLRRIGKCCPGRAIGIRINPEMGLGYRNEPRLVYSAQERPGKFGLLAEQLPETIVLAKEYRLQLNTVHWHIGCGWLNNQLDGLEKILDKATTLVSQLPGIENVNLGGGLGVPFRSDDAALSLQHLGGNRRNCRGRSLEDNAGARFVSRAGRRRITHPSQHGRTEAELGFLRSQRRVQPGDGTRVLRHETGAVFPATPGKHPAN